MQAARCVPLRFDPILSAACSMQHAARNGQHAAACTAHKWHTATT
jgi:hypothetical protein